MICNEDKQGTDTAFRGCLLSLDVADVVTLIFTRASKDIDYNFGITSFRGFLYNPINREAAVAWSVHFDSVVVLIPNTISNLKFENILIYTHRL